MASAADARARAERCISAIARLDPQLRAFITPTPELARAQADAADAAMRAGRTLGPVHGLAMAIKDCVDVAGVRGTAGSRAVIRSARATTARQPRYQPRGICWIRSVKMTVPLGR